MPLIVRRALLYGLVGGLAGIHLGLVGMVDTLQERELLDLSFVLDDAGVALGWLLPALAIMLVGNRAAAPRVTDTGAEASTALRLAAGALTGAVAGLLLAILAFIADSGVIGSMF